MNKLYTYGKYALMLNASTDGIQKRITEVKLIKDNTIAKCRKPFTTRDLEDLVNKKYTSVFDFNYINLMPFDLPK